MNEISKKGLLNLDCMTVTGRTVGENIKDCVNKNPEVIRTIDNPYSKTGGSQFCAATWHRIPAL